MTYRTKQRDVLLDKIMAYEEEPFTADDLILKLMSTSKPVSKATVYRTLDKLERDRSSMWPERVPSTSMLDNSTWTVRTLLLCLLPDVTVPFVDYIFDDLDAHFQNEHHFKIDLQRTILYGLCENCRSYSMKIDTTRPT